MSPAAEQANRTYPTRFRERIALHERYDAIFACVVKKALSETSLPSTPPQSDAIGDEVRKRCTSETLSERSRVRFDSQPTVLPVEGEVPKPQLARNSGVSRRKPNRKPKRKRLYTPKKGGKRKAASVPIEPRVYCHCGIAVFTHALLHEHVLFEHPYPLAVRCSHCNASHEFIRQKHICSICDAFAEDLEEHLKIHYRDCTRPSALMECRMCFKTFQTVHEVVLHERSSHGKIRVPPKFPCEYCGSQFNTKHMRDSHLLTHFEDNVHEIWDRLEQMQNELGEMIVMNQCPICLSVMGSRKGFRWHILQKHLLKEPEAFLEFLSLSSFIVDNTAVKQEPPIAVPNDTVHNGVVVKKEIKVECIE
ncbi:hypothetical protein V3C99_000512 [Haemonchus contortus]